MKLLVVTLVGLISGSAGCFCTATRNWDARWEAPDLLDHLPSDNRSNPSWTMSQNDWSRWFYQAKDEYSLTFTATDGGEAHFEIYPLLDEKLPAKSVALQELNATVREFNVGKYARESDADFSLVAHCN